MKRVTRFTAAALALVLLGVAATAEEIGVDIFDETEIETVEIMANEEMAGLMQVVSLPAEAEVAEMSMDIPLEDGLSEAYGENNAESVAVEGNADASGSKENDVEDDTAQGPDADASDDLQGTAAVHGPISVQCEGAVLVDGVWIFERETDVRFLWTCSDAVRFDCVVRDGDGAVICAESPASGSLSLDASLFSCDAVYALSITAAFPDGGAEATELKFTVINVGVESSPAEAADEASEMTEDEAAATTAEDSEATDSETESDSESESTSSGASSSGSSGHRHSSRTGSSSSKHGGGSNSSASGSKSDKSGQSTGSSASKGEKPGQSTGSSTSKGDRSGQSTETSSSKGKGNSTKDADASDGAQVETSAGALEIEGISVDILLDGGSSTFTAQREGSALRLEPSDEANAWSIGEGALDTLYACGIESLELVLEGRVYTMQISAWDAGEADADVPDGAEAPADQIQTSSPAWTVTEDSIVATCNALSFDVSSRRTGAKAGQ